MEINCHTENGYTSALPKKMIDNEISEIEKTIYRMNKEIFQLTLRKERLLVKRALWIIK
jgi:hypothetical protein